MSREKTIGRNKEDPVEQPTEELSLPSANLVPVGSKEVSPLESQLVASEILEKAEDRLIEATDEFGALVLMQAKILAQKQGHSVITEKHIEDARTLILSGAVTDKKREEIAKIFGAAIFGIAAPGFIYSLGSPFFAAFYAILGLVGALFVVWGVMHNK